MPAPVSSRSSTAGCRCPHRVQRAGGAAGGVFTGVVAPLVFPEFWELPLALLAGFGLAMALLYRGAWPRRRARARVAAVAVATLSVQMRKRGYDTVSIDGVRPLVTGRGMVGRARTLRYVPYRKDLFAAHGGGYNAQKRAFDAVEEGEEVVCTTIGFGETLNGISIYRWNNDRNTVAKENGYEFIFMQDLIK